MSGRESYLAHLTLTTGHLRASPRHEVDAELLGLGQSLITVALAGTPARLPGPFKDYVIEAVRHGRGLIVTVSHQPRLAQPDVIATIGIATRPRDAHVIWPVLDALQTQLGGTMPEQPPAPWCAALVMPGIARYPDTITWLGDFERVLAWAWLEQSRG